MKKNSTKVVAFLLIAIFISACNAVKRVPEGKFLLTKNQILVNNKAIKDEAAFNQMYQTPNGTIAGFRLRLALYNAANLNPDSTYQAKFSNKPGKYERKAKWLSAKQVDRLGESFYYKGIHQFLKKVGEPPVVIDTIKTELDTKKTGLFDNIDQTEKGPLLINKIAVLNTQIKAADDELDKYIKDDIINNPTAIKKEIIINPSRKAIVYYI